MQDFTRIGGAITSAPLNDNFRKLLNDISIANVNLVFPEKNAIVNTVTDMLAIVKPYDAQACYVISSGEFYRYSKGDNKWHKIMDIGQTFRQGFLNSGAVVLEDYIKLKEGSKTILEIPKMLVYFKNKPGDDRYLKGMYQFEAQEFDIDGKVSGANAYTLFIDYTGTVSYITGMPTEDDPDKIYLGTFLVNRNLVNNNFEILENFIYTLPDIAFTADRGHFYLNGGDAVGCNLNGSGNDDNKVNRAGGYYYDEGINFTLGNTDNYPIDTDNGSNFNLKHYNPQTPVEKIYYMTPKNPLNNTITVTDGLVNNKYWANDELVDVPEDYFTIQQHLVTPNGQNIILYGTAIYNSIGDATANLNTTYGIDVDFPYIHATKIVVGNTAAFTTDNPGACAFFTLGRLSQVGTISPQFADNVFKLYSGDANDSTPSTMRFMLDALQKEDYAGLYGIEFLPSNVTRYEFYNDEKYIADGVIEAVQKEFDSIRSNSEDLSGYDLADNNDLLKLKDRVDNIEKEIWNIEKDDVQRYEQSVRYRLFHAEERLDRHDDRLDNHENRIDFMEKHKVHKDTTVNGYTLGDTESNSEAKVIDIQTGDISEGYGLGNNVNLWYTEERVKANSDVAANTAHRKTVSASDNANGHTLVNPHNISTDDVKILQDTTKLFVTPDEERRIRADKLPDDTIQALLDLDEKNMDNLGIYYLEGNSKDPGAGPFKVGDIRSIRFYQDGVNLSMDSDGETLILECVGQMDEKTVMFKSRYATIEAEYPNIYGGYVDNAVNAEYAEFVHGIESALANQYYGTNEENVVGIYDLPKYVSTADAEAFTSIDQVIFTPVDGSVDETKLEPELKEKINNNYHTVYESGVLKSAEINTFNIGDNLSLSIDGHTATINGHASGSGAIQRFINLDDVYMNYTNNEGKVLVVNDSGTGITVANMPSLKAYMLKATYVSDTDITKIKKAEHADNATLADTATNALKLTDHTVNDELNTSAVLWTAEKIISNTSSQIANEGVNTYSGTDVPDNSLGKNGDLYILLED